ncbi:MAG: hypothetical protein IJF66_00445 [Clostridia bacterium]|nr:hypothetical protein [Clostridia bacterium]
MIEFNGMPTGEVSKYVIKQNKKAGWIGGSLGGIVMLAAIIYAAVELQHPIVWLGLIVLALWFLLIALQPFKKDIPKLFATKFIILENGKIIAYAHDETHYSSINSVKRVLDVGNGYVFELLDRNPFFHCQKDQIVKGTIEQFEALFKDKIVRLDENK